MTKKTVAVVDYGMGNLHSIAKALQFAKPDFKVVTCTRPEQVLQADSIVVPGVGAIRDCMQGIRNTGMDEVIIEVSQSKPLLGICIGMQTLMRHSEENGGVECLNKIPGEVRGFGFMVDEFGHRLKVPHMGWNNIFFREHHPIWKGIDDGTRFYFVHSYYVECDNESSVIGTSHYGIPFDAAIHQGNIVATQFHPEKSADAGLLLLKNFLDWDGTAS